MKKIKTFLAMFAFLGLSINVASAQQTQTVTFAGWDGVGMIQLLIQNAINTVHEAGGGTVIVNGEKSNVDAQLIFTIPENVTVTGKPSTRAALTG